MKISKRNREEIKQRRIGQRIFGHCSTESQEERERPEERAIGSEEGPGAGPVSRPKNPGQAWPATPPRRRFRCA